jgi:hypothetical protein
MSARSLNAAWRSTSPKGRNRLAQGFNPGYWVAIGCTLKVAPDRVRVGTGTLELEGVNQLWCPFWAHRSRALYPGLKPWAILSRPLGAKDEDDRSGSTPHP